MKDLIWLRDNVIFESKRPSFGATGTLLQSLHIQSNFLFDISANVSVPVRLVSTTDNIWTPVNTSDNVNDNSSVSDSFSAKYSNLTNRMFGSNSSRVNKCMDWSNFSEKIDSFGDELASLLGSVGHKERQWLPIELFSQSLNLSHAVLVSVNQ